MTCRVLLLLCCLLGALQPVVNAQQPDPTVRVTTRTWTADQGLTAGLVFSLAQTKDGYIYLGTEHGLLRFNGLQFSKVLLDGMPTDTPVLDVLAGVGGSLWLRTFNAELLRLAPGDSVARVVAPLRDASVLAIAPALDDGVIVSSATHGMLRLNGESMRQIGTRGPSMVVTAADAGADAVWLGTRGVGLYRWSGRAIESIGAGIISKKINCLLPGQNGRLWVGTDHGLFTWNGHTATYLKLLDTKEPIHVLSLLQDGQGSLWIGTSRGLLRRKGTNTVWAWANARAVTALLEDRDGDIWFGDGRSLVRLQQSMVVPMDLPAALKGEGNGPVAVDRRRRVWFAPLGGGLYWTADGAPPHKVLSDGLERDVVYSIDCNADDVWAGRRDGGLTRLRWTGSDFSAKTWARKSGLVSKSVHAVRALPDGSVWSGSLTDGANRLQHGALVSFDASSLGSSTVSAIEQTSDGSVWFATPAGLTRFHNGVWSRGVAASSLPSPEVLSLLSVEDKLVVGTSMGIARLDPASGHVDLPSPTMKDPVLGLAVDAEKRLWMATTDRLLSTILPRESATAGGVSLRSFDGRDGLPEPTGVRRMRDLVAGINGEVYLSTQEGLFTIRPALEPVSVPAQAHVVAVLADGSAVAAASPLRIPPDTERTTIEVDGLDYRAPERVLFRYKLDGFDKTWSEPTGSHQLSYTNLRPGRYTFQLVARNSRGEWSSAPTSLALQVQPTLLQRGSFRALCFACVLLAAGLIYHLRMRSVLRQAALLTEVRLAERSHIARELHDTLLQGFISVMMHLHVVTQRLPEEPATRGAVLNVVDMMEQMIEEARLAVEGLRGSRKPRTELESALSAAGKSLGTGSTTAYSFHVVGRAIPLQPVVADEISRIAVEAIRNAFQHAQATTLEVLLDYSKTQLRLQICDNGTGIDEAVLAHGMPGHWGILGMRERARQIGALLRITSSAESGSDVVLTVPARFAFERKRR